MAKAGFRSIDDYIAAQPEGSREALSRVRSAIRKALPGSDEVISYQMPAYRMGGRVILYFAGWKQHYSIYPAVGRLQEVFKDELARYELSKGTIRFPLADPVPVRLIGRIAKFRAQEAAEREKAKAAARKR